MSDCDANEDRRIEMLLNSYEQFDTEIVALREAPEFYCPRSKLAAARRVVENSKRIIKDDCAATFREFREQMLSRPLYSDSELPPIHGWQWMVERLIESAEKPSHEDSD